MLHRPPQDPAPDEQVHRISAAPHRHSDDLSQRISRYLVSMAIRTVCVVLVVVVDGPLRWFFAVGAIGLPYVAVVLANAGARPRDTDPDAPTARPNVAIAEEHAGSAETLTMTYSTAPSPTLPSTPEPSVPYPPVTVPGTVIEEGSVEPSPTCPGDGPGDVLPR